MSAAAWRLPVALGCGVVFGLGLGVSQMSNPEKVLSFLTLGAGWDPSLMLVMASALTVTLIGYRVVHPASPWLETTYHLPSARGPDWRLVSGAVLFGLGWGLAGYCPGPAITALVSGLADPAWFVGGLLAGTWRRG